MLTETTIMLINFAVSAVALSLGLIFFVFSLVLIWHFINKLSAMGRKDDRG